MNHWSDNLYSQGYDFCVPGVISSTCCCPWGTGSSMAIMLLMSLSVSGCPTATGHTGKYLSLPPSYCVSVHCCVGLIIWCLRGLLCGSVVSLLPALQETQVRPLGREDPLEEGMATHSNILAWRIP